MGRHFMIGTLDDTPLLMITVDGEKYLVDLLKKIVFSDSKGLPRITDEATVAAVLKASESTK